MTNVIRLPVAFAPAVRFIDRSERAEVFSLNAYRAARQIDANMADLAADAQCIEERVRAIRKMIELQDEMVGELMR